MKKNKNGDQIKEEKKGENLWSPEDNEPSDGEQIGGENKQTRTSGKSGEKKEQIEKKTNKKRTSHTKRKQEETTRERVT